MEFLSETEGSEYSIKPTYPPGKWFFYEQVLQVPQYAIFEPQQGVLEVYQLNDSGRYDLQQPNTNNHYKIEALGLFLGAWQGTKGNRTGYWLRWWDESGQILPWGVESVDRNGNELNRNDNELNRSDNELKRWQRSYELLELSRRCEKCEAFARVYWASRIAIANYPCNTKSALIVPFSFLVVSSRRDVPRERLYSCYAGC
jgi:hypothetical protein